MPRLFKLVSVAIHAIVITFVVVAQIFSIGPLPVPYNASAYKEYFPIAIDIPLPPPPPRAQQAPETAAAAHTAPIDAPNGVTPETGLERSTTESVHPGVVDGVERGGDVDLGAIPGMSAPPPPPPAPAQKPIPLHQGIQPPRKIVDVQPVYPALARSARQQGIVILETVIDAKGMVENVRVLRGYPLLDDAAVDAVRQWRFTPALLNGQPVPVVMTVTVNFELVR